jgi:hypothetical protein
MSRSIFSALAVSTLAICLACQGASVQAAAGASAALLLNASAKNAEEQGSVDQKRLKEKSKESAERAPETQPITETDVASRMYATRMYEQAWLRFDRACVPLSFVSVTHREDAQKWLKRKQVEGVILRESEPYKKGRQVSTFSNLMEMVLECEKTNPFSNSPVMDPGINTDEPRRAKKRKSK